MQRNEPCIVGLRKALRPQIGGEILAADRDIFGEYIARKLLAVLGAFHLIPELSVGGRRFCQNIDAVACRQLDD